MENKYGYTLKIAWGNIVLSGLRERGAMLDRYLIYTHWPIERA